MAKNGENYKKSAWITFLALTSPKYTDSEESNEQFQRKSVAHGQMTVGRETITKLEYKLFIIG